MPLDVVRRILEDHDEVRLGYVFGSVAAGRASPSSDLDVAVLMVPGTGQAILVELSDALTRASGRTTHLIDLAVAPPLLAHEVIRQGRLIVNRDDDARVDFVTRAIARYLDTAHLRRVQHGYLRERVEARGAASR